MQPNGNVPGVGRPVAGAPMNNVNAKPAPVPITPPTSKPVEPAFGNGGSVVEGKGGKKTGWILAVVFLLIVAAGGVGFGVWAMMDGNAQKDALNSQISALKQQNNDLQEQIEEMAAKNNTTGSAGDNANMDENYTYVGKADYLNIEDWGMKIKMPADLDFISYALVEDTNNEEKTTLMISGAKTGFGQSLPDFANMNITNGGMGYVMRYMKGAEVSGPSAPVFVFSDGEYDYYWSSLQMAWTAFSDNTEEQQWETESVTLILDTIKNPENYSKI